jgi:4-carboxymuconolactone decarboxylase
MSRTSEQQPNSAPVRLDAKHYVKRRRAGVLAVALSLGLATALSQAAANAQESQGMTRTQTTAPSASEILTARQQAIVPIAAFAVAGDIAKLNAVLSQGLDAGLTVSEAKEVLVQLYAYAGFPRSLNALGELMKVLETRKLRGIQDAPGRAPSRAIPKGEALLAAGTANQTKLSGGPVKGPLFDFAPAIDEYLKTHLFGDIFERDSLDWQSRELATVGMLSALPGAESQLQAHMRISMNVGLTAGQLRQLTQVLADHVDAEHARRAREALERHLTTTSGAN